MRLIDADALIEEIKNKMSQGSARGVFLAFVDDIPTAYDVVLVEDMKEQIGASGEYMDNKLREWIERLESGDIDG